LMLRKNSDSSFLKISKRCLAKFCRRELTWDIILT
jgi:hypothetical protein